MRNKYLLVPALSVCLLVIGCGGKEAQVAGVWQGTDMKFQTAIPPAFQDAIKKKLSALTLELKPDRTFTMTEENGTWSIANDKVILKVASIGGKTPAEVRKSMDEQLKSMTPEMRAEAEGSVQDQQEGILSADGKTMSIVVGKITVVFTKKAS